jgi:hypothetical protein
MAVSYIGKKMRGTAVAKEAGVRTIQSQNPNDNTAQMKMTNYIQSPLFPTTSGLPMPPDFGTSRTAGADTRKAERRARGAFDIHDAEGHMPEILCRVMLGICFLFTLVECAVQLAAS